MDYFCVVLPAYNEAENIACLMEKWFIEADIIAQRYGLMAHFIFVNDCSTDKTKAVITSLMKEHENISIINHAENRGLGSTIISGFHHVLVTHPQCPYICVMDCDNTHYPEFATSMLGKIQATTADVVIASRYLTADKQKDLALSRRVMSAGAKYFYTLSMGVKNVTDYTNGYRIYSTNILKTAFQVYGEALIEEKTFACTTELLCKLSLLGAKFAEVPFTLHYGDKKGNSKMKVLSTAISSVVMAKKLVLERQNSPHW